MKIRRLRRSVAVPLVLLTLAGGVISPATGSDPDAPAARFIRASISVDGAEILRAATSDDGHPDADAVWNYLLGRLEFEPTKDFAKAKIDPKARTVTLGWLKGAKTKHLGEPPKLELSVAYGGWDRPFRLTLERIGKDGRWRVGRKTVEGRFPHRWIRREQAAALANHRRKK